MTKANLVVTQEARSINVPDVRLNRELLESLDLRSRHSAWQLADFVNKLTLPLRGRVHR